MPRGGRRTGTPGKSYGNRSDLNGPKLPVMRAPSSVYGEQAQLTRDQQAVPMGSTPSAPGPGPEALTDTMAPVGAVDFTRPTERPDEPVTHGSPTGPGGGPEVLAMNQQPNPLVSAVGILNSLGAGVSPQIKALRAQVNTQLANQAAP